MQQHIEQSLRNTDKYVSGCDRSVFLLDGMSGKKTRHFYNNICSLPGARYLEIGSWKGSTLCAALSNNTIECVAIDSHIQQDLRTNVANYIGNNKVRLVEADSWNVLPEELGMKFNIYMYDGDHERVSHRKALTHYAPAMDDTFIYIVDDWNDLRVRQGTMEGISQAKLSIDYQREIFTSDDNTHSKVYGKDSDWHNGIAIFVLHK